MESIKNDVYGYEIITGDCLEGMRAIESESIDTVLTDPPFSSGGREASKNTPKSMTRSVAPSAWFGSDNMTVSGFSYLMREAAREWHRVLKPGGHAFIFIDWRMMSHLSSVIESADLMNRGVLVWNKTYFGMGVHFRSQHEFVLHFTKSAPRAAVRRNQGNVLDHKPIRNGDHPTQKPVQLLRDILSVVSAPGDRVLDCFNGSGSSGVAALLNGCSYVGIERDPNYVEATERRLLNFPSEAAK